MTSGGTGHIEAASRHEARQQCLVRDANEAIERQNETLAPGAARLPMRCECGDSRCHQYVCPTREEYEAVRVNGSHFVIGRHHENSETACVLRESARFSVIDVVEPAARYTALALATRRPGRQNPPRGGGVR
jgi:hypothetical protein